VHHGHALVRRLGENIDHNLVSPGHLRATTLHSSRDLIQRDLATDCLNELGQNRTAPDYIEAWLIPCS
jgi:hypothetical protein